MKTGFKPKRMRYRWKPFATKVDCGECGTLCRPTKGALLYPAGHDQASRNFYVCPNCDARASCHLDTWAPMSIPANAHTRYLRHTAHATLDPIWLEQWGRWAASPRLARVAVYRWAAAALGVPTLDFHIGNLNAAQCEALIAKAKIEYDTYSKNALDT